VAVLLVPLLGSLGVRGEVPVLATSVFTRALPPPPSLGSSEMTAI
jgi:hypothetical protein